MSSNKGSHTPGVDGTVWNTNESKAQAILELKQEGYRAKPLRRKYIPKTGSNKMRPLGIPTMKDRAMQAVYASALEPVEETTGDPKLLRLSSIQKLPRCNRSYRFHHAQIRPPPMDTGRRYKGML
ncbi:MAG: hypothetical protein L6W00_00390 [Lentisphaeria bacterium]|nr:MAG: hypothetical protein L6W00_00390 [Lentisphaeria bacterium]